MQKLITAFLLAAFAMGAGPGTSAAATPADKCEAGKNKIAGAYYACREKAESTAITKAVAADYSKCSTKFDEKWSGAESKGEGACPDNVLTAPMNAFLAAQADQAALVIAGLQGIPTCGDGTINVAGEHCDGGDLGGFTCGDLGFPQGDLACTPDCKFDVTACSTCEGFVYGGNCWFLGALGESCDATCAAVGEVYDSSTLTSAGSLGTGAVCDDVLDGLGVPGSGTSSFICISGLGCQLDNISGRAHCASPATTSVAAHPQSSRACACE